MKRLLTAQITTLLIFFLFTACHACLRVDKPNDVQPINPNGYNRVYDVYWNYKMCTDDVEDWNFEIPIKIHAWLRDPSSPRLTDSGEEELHRPYADVPILVRTDNEAERLQLDSLFQSITTPKECHVRGALIIEDLNNNARTDACLVVKNINDFLFKE